MSREFGRQAGWHALQGRGVRAPGAQRGGWITTPLSGCATLFAISFILAGCSGSVEFADVRGVVKLSGEPLPDVRVTFVPDASDGLSRPIATAVTDQTGTYSITRSGSTQGIAVGTYLVTVEDERVNDQPRGGRESEDERPSGRGPPAESRVPPKYRIATQSSIQCSIKPGQNVFDVGLSPVKKTEPQRQGRGGF